MALLPLRLELALRVTFLAIFRTSASSSGVGFKRVMILATLLAKLLGCPSVGLISASPADLCGNMQGLESLEGQGLCLL